MKKIICLLALGSTLSAFAVTPNTLSINANNDTANTGLGATFALIEKPLSIDCTGIDFNNVNTSVSFPGVQPYVFQNDYPKETTAPFCLAYSAAMAGWVVYPIPVYAKSGDSLGIKAIASQGHIYFTHNNQLLDGSKTAK